MRLAGRKDATPGPTVYIRITSPHPKANAHITLKDTTVAVVRDLIQTALNAEMEKGNDKEHAHAGAS